jgi:HEPN domain-containing protein
MRGDTKNWLESAKYDLESARYMLSSQRYLYVVFLCHLAVEKTLKALVSELTQSQAPRSHDLVYLVKRSGILPDSKQMDFISIMNNASIITRYPEDFQQAIDAYSGDVAGDYLQKTEEVIKWLKQRPELNE